jgi:parallel beta-helix repeat protein
VKFLPAVEGKPWGTFALQGEGANGSELEHVRFSGGGGAFLGRVEYKGMVSVHRTSLVSLRNCELSDNVRSDDALNAIHSNLTIEHCTFRRANSDAVDFDYSSGKIANNRFEASANDAIDLMGSSPQIIGNHITGSGDKGISIGEGSHPFVFNNYIARSNRGIEVKDRSEPFLVHNTIIQNSIGILQSAKNWRYGSGGWGKLVNTIVAENKTDIESDQVSRLTTADFGAATKGPMPVSAKAGSSAPTEAAWILAHHGIRTASNAVGQIDSWMAVDPSVPKVLSTFEDNFEAATDGWAGAGGVSRLEKRDQDLQATLSRRRGHISRNVDWNLTDPGYTYVAVFEVAGRNLRSAGISILSADSEITQPFAVAGNPASYGFVTVEMKPDYYTTIKIVADPGTNTGRIRLHTYRLYAIPKLDQTKAVEDSIPQRGKNG